MRVLVIDTSARPRVALIEAPGGDPAAARTVGEHAGAVERRHAEELAPAVARLVGDVPPGLVVVGTGPGPFTGLRVGLVTARTLGRGWGADVAGVPSLDGLARTALDDLPGRGRTVLVVTDARRREVYHARYAAAGPHEVEVLAAPAVAPPAEVTALRRAGDALVGPMAAAVAAQDPTPQPPSADGLPLALARLALTRLAAGADLPTEPLYLRRPDAAVPAQARP